MSSPIEQLKQIVKKQIVSSQELEQAKELLQNKIRIQTVDSENLLFEALSNQQDDLVELFLEHGANITQQTDKGSSPLQLILQNRKDKYINKTLTSVDPKRCGHVLIELLRLDRCDKLPLLFNYAEQNNQLSTLFSAEQQGSYAIHFAAKLARINLVTEFFKKGANINQTDSINDTPLSLLAREISKTNQEIFSFIDHNKNQLDLNSLATAVYRAVAKENFSLVKKILIVAEEKGWLKTLVNIQVGNKKQSLIHFSADSDNEKITALLLNYGASPSLQNTDNQTPLNFVKSNAVFDLIIQSELYNPESISNDLLDAIITNNNYRINKLLDLAEKRKFSIEKLLTAKDPKQGLNPLFHAALKNNNLAIKRLLELGANPEQYDHKNKGLISYLTDESLIELVTSEKYYSGENIASDLLSAVCKPDKSLIDRLLKIADAKSIVGKKLFGASHTKNGYNALCYAIKASDLDLVKKFVARGANSEYFGTEEKQSVVCLADHSEQIVDELLKSPSFSGKSLAKALIHAAVFNKTWLVEKLLAKAKQLHIDKTTLFSEVEVKSGNSALHIAVNSENPLIVKMLLAAGADPVLPNSEGKTPIELAEKQSWLIEIFYNERPEFKKVTVNSSRMPSLESIFKDFNRRYIEDEVGNIGNRRMFTALLEQSTDVKLTQKDLQAVLKFKKELKNDMFDLLKQHLKTLANIDEKIKLLADILNKDSKTGLSILFYLQRGFTKPSIKTGVLSKIYELQQDYFEQKEQLQKPAVEENIPKVEPNETINEATTKTETSAAESHCQPEQSSLPSHYQQAPMLYPNIFGIQNNLTGDEQTMPFTDHPPAPSNKMPLPYDPNDFPKFLPEPSASNPKPSAPPLEMTELPEQPNNQHKTKQAIEANEKLPSEPKPSDSSVTSLLKAAKTLFNTKPPADKPKPENQNNKETEKKPTRTLVPG